MRHKMISIIGASHEELTPELLSFAQLLGQKLAKVHFGIICDGKDGISEVVCKSLIDFDHGAPVVALVNGSDIACQNGYCSVVIPTGQAWGSDRLVANGGDVVVVIGGGVTALALLDFLCTHSDKQILCVSGVSPVIDAYIQEHAGDEHLTAVRTAEEILWYLEVLTEEFSFLPKQSGCCSVSKVHKTVANNALL